MRLSFVVALVACFNFFESSGLLFPQASKTTPVPFQFHIDSLTITSKEKALLHDSFRDSRVLASRYKPLVGHINRRNVGARGLTIDDKSTNFLWNVDSLLLPIPLSTSNSNPLPGKDLFPFEISVRLTSLRLQGPERLYIGLMDPKTLHNVGSVALGVQGIERLPDQLSSRIDWKRSNSSGALGLVRRTAFEEHWNDKLQSGMQIGPAISIVRAEEPEISGDIVLASRLSPTLATADSVEISLRVSADGTLSASGTIISGSKKEEFTLTPSQQTLTPFLETRKQLDVNESFVPFIYVKTLPRVSIVSVARTSPPRVLDSGAQTIPIVVHGIGFGLDSQIKAIPEGGGQEAEVRNISIGRDCLSLKADVIVPIKASGQYSIIVSSAGNQVVVQHAISLTGNL
jgi:hypothetical protein